MLPQQKTKKSGSLVFYITLLYIFLTIINIVFFTVMIFENQMDLLVTNFKFHSENLINSVLYEIEDVAIREEKDEDFTKLQSVLLSNGIENYIITDSDANIIFNIQQTEKNPQPENFFSKIKLFQNKEIETISLPPNFSRKIQEIKNISAIMKSRYNVELNADDFTVQFILPIRKSNATDNNQRSSIKEGKTNTADDYYLYTIVSIKLILERLKLLYVQLVLAVTWGILFHFIFAIFVYRLIFKRLNKLEDASVQMAEGNLKARADWEFKREDELDNLGKSFNLMAGKIETTVNRLTDINEQMQMELEIGKTVQELFLPISGKIFKDFNIAHHFQPMREVSGDVYNYYKFNEKLRSVFLADATGHGVSAALVTTVIMNNLNTMVNSSYIPSKILKNLNLIMYDTFQSAFYASAIMYLFDNKGNVYYGNAGHNPPLYIQFNEKKIAKLFARDTILGLDNKSEFKTHKLTANPKDRFLFYTDGLVETKNHEEKMFSLDKVEELILLHFEKSNKEIVDILHAELEHFAARYDDDVTFILLEIPAYEA